MGLGLQLSGRALAWHAESPGFNPSTGKQRRVQEQKNLIACKVLTKMLFAPSNNPLDTTKIPASQITEDAAWSREGLNALS